MLKISNSRIVEAFPMEVVPGTLSIEEGQALVYENVGGRTYVKPSTGAANEFFAGFATSYATTPTNGPMVQTFTVPSASPYTVKLARTPFNTTIGVVILASGSNAEVVLVAGSAASATEYVLAGDVITLHSSFAGRSVRVTYRYTLSHQEAVYKFNYDGFASVDLSGVPYVTVIKDAIELATDFYDPSSNWASWTGATAIKLGPNGTLTLSGSGATLDTAVLRAAPTSEDGFLTIGIAAR